MISARSADILSLGNGGIHHERKAPEHERGHEENPLHHRRRDGRARRGVRHHQALPRQEGAEKGKEE